LSFELKAARIAESDIAAGRGVSARLMAAFEKDKPKAPMALAGDRYPIVDIDDNILSNGLLVDYLVRGIVDPNAIRKELSASRFFIKVTDEEPWRTVWHWFERSDAEFSVAFTRMEEQFKSRAFTKGGEILHVLGLRLFHSDQGFLQLSKADIVAQGKQYIDDVSAAKKLEVPSSGDASEIRFQGWGGFQISESDTAEYKILYDHLILAIQRSVEDTYPQKANELLSTMKSDVDSFYRQVSLSHADTTDYVLAPVLAKLPVDDFVNAFFDLHPSKQRLVMAALKGRYQFDRLSQSLKEEKPWVRSLYDALQKRSLTLIPIARYRLEKQLEWYEQAVSSKRDSDEGE
jgi:co-chaperonin GroES (HSP10)